MTSERRRSESFRGERPNAGQAIGFVFTLAGDIATSLLKDNSSSTASAAMESESNRPTTLASLRTGLSLRHLFFWEQIFLPL